MHVLQPRCNHEEGREVRPPRASRHGLPGGARARPPRFRTRPARGWRIIYLGTDTPITSVADAARSCNPAATVVSAVDPRAFRRHADELQQLALETRLCLGGAGAEKASLVDGALQLTANPVDEAEQLTQLARSNLH